eukprot:scaffold2119_cov67-Phaeocystis_antarctica.AAC.11
MSTGGPGPKTGSDADVWANQVSGLAKHMGKDDDPDWDETEQSEHPGCVPLSRHPTTRPPARNFGSNKLLSPLLIPTPLRCQRSSRDEEPEPRGRHLEVRRRCDKHRNKQALQKGRKVVPGRQLHALA